MIFQLGLGFHVEKPEEVCLSIQLDVVMAGKEEGGVCQMSALTFPFGISCSPYLI